MNNMGQMEIALQRIEDKLDAVKDSLHAMAVAVAETTIKQSASEVRLIAAETEIKQLKSAHDRAIGVLKALSVPGILSSVYTLIHLFAK